MNSIIPYPSQPDPFLAAQALNRVLEGGGWRVQVTWDDEDDGGHVVQVTRREQPFSRKGLFRPGSRLVVGPGRQWLVEAGPGRV